MTSGHPFRPTAGPADIGGAYRNYFLTIVTIVFAFNFVDRLALGVVLEDIKVDLGLTDTQLGLMSGIAFALFYAVMGIPIARWADRGNRVTIIALTTFVWSVAVALCGAATSFLQLLVIRVGVAVGEAGCVPPAHSLIADYFTRAERPRAVALYMLGGPIALIVGYFAAGWFNTWLGWRTTFVIIGLPGILMAALVQFTLREPRRAADHLASAAAHPGATGQAEPDIRKVLVTLWRNAAFRHLSICFSVWFFFGYGLLQWQPTFFVRSHHLESGELGIWLAAVYGGGGLIGTYLGGEWCSRRAANNERLQLNACAAAFVLFGVLTAAAQLATTYHMAFAALLLANIGGNMSQGPIVATMQTLVPPRMRAMSIAITYLFANLIGMGLGPLAAGALSDGLRPWFGEESLRYALVILCPGYFWAAWHLWRAGRTVARDVAGLQIQDAVPTDVRVKMAVNR
jgi:MFS family permease